MWSLTVDVKVDLQELLSRIDKVGSFTLRYDATELLLSFTCESGTYHTFLPPACKSAQGELLIRRDEHKGETDLSVDILALGICCLMAITLV